jgi:hypothetical protein
MQSTLRALCARSHEGVAQLLRRRTLRASQSRRAGSEIPIAAVGGLARDPQCPCHVCERAAGPKRALDVNAGYRVELAVQLDQRLESAQRTLRISRLSSEAAKSVFESSHS